MYTKLVRQNPNSKARGEGDEAVGGEKFQVKDPIRGLRICGGLPVRVYLSREPSVTGPGSRSAVFLPLPGGVCLVGRERRFGSYH